MDGLKNRLTFSLQSAKLSVVRLKIKGKRKKMFRFKVSDEEVAEAAKQLTVEEFFAKRKSFTAFDVTTELRRIAGAGINIAHEIVREVVHEVMYHALELGLYTKEDKDFSQRFATRQVTATFYQPTVSEPQASSQKVTSQTPNTWFRTSASSWIHSVHYNELAENLIIFLQDESILTYENVPYRVFCEYKSWVDNGGSAGTFWHRNLKLRAA